MDLEEFYYTIQHCSDEKNKWQILFQDFDPQYLLNIKFSMCKIENARRNIKTRRNIKIKINKKIELYYKQIFYFRLIFAPVYYSDA